MPRKPREVIEVKLMLLPPAKDKCQCCAVDHPPKYPHNQQSLFWHSWFYGQYGRWPTWWDAIAHCEQPVQDFWLDALQKRDVDMGDKPDKVIACLVLAGLLGEPM